MAVITTDPRAVGGGGVPVFLAADTAQQDRIASILTRVTLGMVHDLGNGVWIVVRH